MHKQLLSQPVRLPWKPYSIRVKIFIKKVLTSIKSIEKIRSVVSFLIKQRGKICLN